MRSLLIRWLVLAAALWVTDWLLSGVTVEGGVATYLIVAAVLSVLNALLRPILMVLSCPFIILTLGLFIFVVNTAIFMLASGLVPGFSVAGFGTALVASILVSIVSAGLGMLLHEDAKG